MTASPTSDRSGGFTLGSVVLWGVLYVVARMGLNVVERGSALAWTLALLPVPAFIAALLFIVRSVRRADELERRIQLEALAIAFPLAVVLVMVLGLLELATNLNPADWSYRHVWPMIAMFWFAGQAIARRRYA